MTTTKRSVAYRISRQAECHLNRIIRLTGMTKTAAVELAVTKLSLSLGGNMNTHNISNIISLREALHNVLEMAAENLESVVIAYSDGTYEAAPLASWREYAREEQGAEIFYTIRSLEEFGEDATADDIPAIIDEYILPALRSS